MNIENMECHAHSVPSTFRRQTSQCESKSPVPIRLNSPPVTGNHYPNMDASHIHYTQGNCFSSVANGAWARVGGRTGGLGRTRIWEPLQEMWVWSTPLTLSGNKNTFQGSLDCISKG